MEEVESKYLTPEYLLRPLQLQCLKLVLNADISVTIIEKVYVFWFFNRHRVKGIGPTNCVMDKY